MISHYSPPSMLQQKQMQWMIAYFKDNPWWRYDYTHGQFIFFHDDVAFMFALRWGELKSGIVIPEAFIDPPGIYKEAVYYE